MTTTAAMAEWGDAAGEAFTVGTKLEGMELVAAISSGGMSRVWLAAVRGPRGETLGFRVVKSPRASADRAFDAMLVEEGRLAARVHHPNVAKVYGVGTHRGIPYVVMEYVRGVVLGKLRSKLAALRLVLPPGWVAALGAAYARGLHAAHVSRDERGVELGLVHCDVSPSNLMITSDGIPMVIDFGVAKATRTEPPTKGFKGTVRYAAPEQLRGELVDARADVYGLGAVLFELCTGTRLFDEMSYLELAERTKPVPPMSAMGAAVPPELESTIRRCIDPAGARRLRSALFVAHALERYLAFDRAPSAAQVGKLVEAVRKDVSRDVLLSLGMVEAAHLRARRPTPSELRVIPAAERNGSELDGTATVGDLAESTPSAADASFDAEACESPGTVHDVDDPSPTMGAGLDAVPTVVRGAIEVFDVDDPLPTTRTALDALPTVVRRSPEAFDVDDPLPTRPHITDPKLLDECREDASESQVRGRPRLVAVSEAAESLEARPFVEEDITPAASRRRGERDLHDLVSDAVDDELPTRPAFDPPASPEDEAPHDAGRSSRRVARPHDEPPRRRSVVFRALPDEVSPASVDTLRVRASTVRSRPSNSRFALIGLALSLVLSAMIGWMIGGLK